MNVKKIILSLILVVILELSITMSFSGVNAKSETTSMYLGLSKFMTQNPNWGYSIKGYSDNYVGDFANRKTARIWNILKYTSLDPNSAPYNNDEDIFCLREGEGFLNINGQSDIGVIKEYNESFNMKSDKEEVKSKVHNWDKTIDGVNQYDAILAVLDLFYVQGSSDEYRETLLKNANIYKENWDEDAQITNEDIKVVEQVALWYFTNYGENNQGLYDQTSGDSWLFYTTDGKKYSPFMDYKHNDGDNGIQRNTQANLLYNYLIKTAKENAKSRTNSATAKEENPIKIETSELDYKLDDSKSNYIVGPIKISSQASESTLDNITVTLKKDGSTSIDNSKIKFLKSDGKTETSDIKSELNNNFYISIPKTDVGDISKLEVKFKNSYSNTILKLWTNSTDKVGTQPVVIPERTSGEDEQTLHTKQIEPEFDLKLIKRITAVNDQNVPERIESVDVSKLNTIGEDGKKITTGDYKLNKTPVGVKKGDIVTYTFRIYNEGTLDGYASKITEDIPEGLEFIWSEKTGDELKSDTILTDAEKEAIEFNQNYLWGDFKYTDSENKEKITEISTNYLSKEIAEGNLIKAFGENDGTKTENDISYKEVSVRLKVVAEDKAGNIIRNEACISEDADKDGNPVDDRDSKPEEWKKYEDDEDYDNIILQSFDLALRKFIIAVSDDDTIEDGEYLKNTDGSYTRAPVVDTSELNTEDENGKLITTATYNHTKEPLIVKPNDIVVYMLRVYNEGETDGYASEIKDHLPPTLEYVESDFNKKYGWAVSEDGRTVTTRYLENSKITKPSKNKEDKLVLAYKEVPIMCKVKENAKTNEKITNIADITEYLDENKNKVTDRDSQPNNVVLPEDEKLPSYKDDEKGDYIPGQQDDDDFEKVIVKVFDLALRKWVTQAIVIENGQQSITNTGHDAWDDPEEIVKVDLNRKKLNQVTVKFRYSIRIYNQGDVEGYAKEITDYIPEGLKFVAEDNPGWKDEGNNVISTTLLENTLLKPGEYADVEVLLTWINDENNMGLKVNTAEISKDYNEYNLPDIDSTPDNKKQGEDDIDDAPVMLSVSTGQIRIYFTVGLIILVTIAGGTILIKKYVI